MASKRVKGTAQTRITIDQNGDSFREKASLPVNKVICGDALEELKRLPDESINMILTSPPYYGLRDYGVKGQIGLEPTLEGYVADMKLIFQEVFRILRKDGTYWLNMSDTYGGSCSGHGDTGLYQKDRGRKVAECMYGKLKPQRKFKPKCMLCIPERLAFACLDLGFILRNKIIWHKPNAMPSSVKDRFTNIWEYLYFFSKNRKYYFDLDSVRVPHKTRPAQFNYRVREAKNGNFGITGVESSPEEMKQYDVKDQKIKTYNTKFDERSHAKSLTQKRCYVRKVLGMDDTVLNHPLGKNPGDVITQKQEAVLLHFRRKGSGGNYDYGGLKSSEAKHLHPNGKNPGDMIEADPVRHKLWLKGKTKAWMSNPGHPFANTCTGKPQNPGDFWEINTKPFPGAHFAVFPEALCERPIKAGCPPDGIVLDPFCGSGTTLMMAKRLGRRYIGIDLVPAYVEMAKRRLEQ